MPAVLSVGEAAHWLGAVPLIWLTQLPRRPAVWWWLAAAFGVSFAADSAAHWLDPQIVSNLYPLTQAALVGLALLTWENAVRLAGMLAAVSIVALLWRGPDGRDILLNTVAFGSVAGLAWRDRGPWRGSLLVTFGLGLVAWWGYCFAPGWWTWSEYQLTRLAGTGLFCRAALKGDA